MTQETMKCLGSRHGSFLKLFEVLKTLPSLLPEYKATLVKQKRREVKMNELVDKNKVMQILHNVCDRYNHGAKVHEALREAETSVNGLVTHTVPESARTGGTRADEPEDRGDVGDDYKWGQSFEASVKHGHIDTAIDDANRATQPPGELVAQKADQCDLEAISDRLKKLSTRMHRDIERHAKALRIIARRTAHDLGADDVNEVFELTEPFDSTGENQTG